MLYRFTRIDPNGHEAEPIFEECEDIEAARSYASRFRFYSDFPTVKTRIDGSTTCWVFQETLSLE